MEEKSNKTEIMKREIFESGNFHTLSMHARHVGEIHPATSSAYVKGPCGDEMIFFLLIKNEIIKEVRFLTSGCSSSVACAEVASILAEERSVSDALGISSKEVLYNLKDLPADHIHCSILAVTTLYKAISHYLLRKTDSDKKIDLKS